MLRIICPYCEKIMGLPQATAHAVAACPTCGKRFRIPLPDVGLAGDPTTPIAAVPEGAPEPPAPSPGLPSDIMPDVKPPYRRSRKRYEYGPTAGSSARAGRSLLIVLVGIYALVQIAGLAVSAAISMEPEELTGPIMRDVHRNNPDAIQNRFFVFQIQRMIGYAATSVLAGLLWSYTFKGLSWARMALAVYLFASMCLPGCATLQVFTIGKEINLTDGARLPVLIVAALTLSVYPTIGFVLLASNGIREYCSE